MEESKEVHNSNTATHSNSEVREGKGFFPAEASALICISLGHNWYCEERREEGGKKTEALHSMVI